MTQKLNSKSIYVFCGHGSGSDAVGGWGRIIRKGIKVSFISIIERSISSIKAHCHLIGCSSGRLRECGRTEPRGTPLKILDSGSPSCMSLLWSITDRDIDRYTLRLYADWFSAVRQRKGMKHFLSMSPGQKFLQILSLNSQSEPGPNLSRFIKLSECACKLGPLNGGAVVHYGIIPNCINVPQNWNRGLPQNINYKN